uniref:Uncharacterized protein n=1 Tax=Arundo donax TaxID=35708 RepID=A0A0A8YLT0_ARUDO
MPWRMQDDEGQELFGCHVRMYRRRSTRMAVSEEEQEWDWSSHHCPKRLPWLSLSAVCRRSLR